MSRIIAFAGSSRRESLNRKLAHAAVEIGAEADVTLNLIELGDFPMPLYNGDMEDSEGLPESAKRLKDLVTAADGLLIVTPEYNSSITPLLKNTIDWLSRTETDDEPTLSAYRGKVAGLLSASPGGLGGLRALFHLREILQNIGVTVVPKQFALSSADKHFDDDGRLADDRIRGQIRQVILTLAEMTKKLNQPLS